MAYSTLFSPVTLRGLTLKNRIVFPAMGTKMATQDKHVTQQLIDYHVARAEGGNGLNITEVCSVYAPASPRQFLSIAEDSYVPTLKKLVDAVHQSGGKIAAQLWLGGMAATHGDPSQKIIIPSDVPMPHMNYVIPGATLEEIRETIEAFGKAAARAVQAGFDAVEFHAGHNYTAHSFLSPYFNHRTDAYGGSLENRSRYLLEVITSIRENIPESMPLLMRIDAHDDYLEGGLTIEEVISFCKWAGQKGVDVLDVSRGNFSSAGIKYEVPSIDIPKGFNIENAKRIKDETGLLTIGVGRINDPQQAENILNETGLDMVVMGRAQLADPEFCNKAMAGKTDDIVKCVGCNQGCYDRFVDESAPFISCLRNPSLGREREYELVQASCAKNVLIAGGGVAGLETAMLLKKRGHAPILFESTNQLGGQFALAGMAPRKEEMRLGALDMGRQVQALGIPVHLQEPVTVQTIQREMPDAVVIAIGSEPIQLQLEGSDLPHVLSSHDVLEGKVTVKGKVTVIGGGLVGLEVAEHVEAMAENVTVIEMQNEVAKDLGQIRKVCVLEQMAMSGINAITDAKCSQISSQGVVVEVDGIEKLIEADTVIMAVGSRSRDSSELVAFCETNAIPYYIIGDALKARRALNAIEEANSVARQI